MSLFLKALACTQSVFLFEFSLLVVESPGATLGAHAGAALYLCVAQPPELCCVVGLPRKICLDDSSFFLYGGFVLLLQ